MPSEDLFSKIIRVYKNSWDLLSHNEYYDKSLDNNTHKNLIQFVSRLVDIIFKMHEILVEKKFEHVYGNIESEDEYINCICRDIRRITGTCSINSLVEYETLLNAYVLDIAVIIIARLYIDREACIDDVIAWNDLLHTDK